MTMMEKKLAQLRDDRAFAKSKMDVAEMTNNPEMYDKYAKMFDEATDAIRKLREESNEQSK